MKRYRLIHKKNINTYRCLKSVLSKKRSFFYSVVDPNTWNLDQDPDLELWAQFGSGSKDYVMLLSFEKK